MPDMDPRFGPHSDLTYEGVVAGQTGVGKSGYEYGVGTSLALPAMSGLPRQVSVYHGSDPDTNTNTPSLSAKSFFSDLSEVDQPFTPDAIVDQPSPNNAWADFDRRSYNKFEPSTTFEAKSDMLSFAPHPAQAGDVAEMVDSSRLQNVGLGASLSTVEGSQVPGFREMAPASGTAVESGGTGWANPFFQNDVTQWHIPKYANDLTGLPYYHKNQRTSGSLDQVGDGTSVPYSSHTQVDAAYRSYDRDKPPRNAPARDSVQICRNDESQDQRKVEDSILLEGKAAGLTYKEIREKMPTKVAESTLRGRYRSLTKVRKDRVRKPVWTENDVSPMTPVPVHH